MPTKKILLRGISRTPSDRMSADGGLAESIGFENNMQELAVNVPATDETSNLNVASPSNGEFVFIHRTNDYANYIATTSAGVYWQNNNVADRQIYTFETGERLKEIKSIGNTLVLLTEKQVNNVWTPLRMEYVLFKNGTYHDLGDEIPEPSITVEPELRNDSGVRGINTIWTNPTSGDIANQLKLLGGAYNPPLDGYDEDDIKNWSGITKSTLESVIEQLRGKAESVIKQNREWVLSRPVFVRWALRLYDGTYIRHSAPVLVDPDNFSVGDKFCEFNYFYRDDQATNNTSLEVDSTQSQAEDYPEDWLTLYVLSFKMTHQNDYENWKDIIAGVDLFISTDIDLMTYELVKIDNFGVSSHSWASTFHFKQLRDETLAERLLASSNFNLVKKIDIDRYIASAVDGGSGVHTEIVDDFTSQYDTALPDDIANSNNKFIPQTIRVYNERLLAVGATIQKYAGYYELPSRKTLNTSQAAFKLRFYIETIAGNDCIVEKSYPAGTYQLGNWIYYPDPRCYKCEVMADEPYGDITELTRFKMKEHPFLNGAYFLCPFGESVLDNGEVIDDPNLTDIADKENRNNTLFQFESQNMFLSKSEQSFPYGRLIDLAVITKPLSTGQVGYSNLYIFSEQGLWAIASSKDGSLGDVDAVSQDVALPGTVCQLNQAVVFTTASGVMLLTGMDLRCISERMHGRHYKLDDAIYDTLISTSFNEDWGKLATMAHEDMPFMTYMQDARTAYDYVNRRLLFFNVSSNRPDYIYTYMLETDTWHKIAMPEGYEFQKVLNSYPDTLIAVEHTSTSGGITNHSGKIMSFSKTRSQSDTTRYKAMLVTRPMDLEEDDVRKVMNRLFIRGSYPKTFQKSAQVEDRPVKFVLMGSADGQTWQVLRSMRGGSYKLFRLVLLCQLTQTERISYVEAEYESRYTNRLR